MELNPKTYLSLGVFLSVDSISILKFQNETELPYQICLSL